MLNKASKYIDNFSLFQNGFIERLVVWGLAFILFALFTPRMLDYLRPPTGDEAFYLITAQSLLYDRDLDESNQYSSKSWLEFYPGCDEYTSPDWKGFRPPGMPCSGAPILKPQSTTTTQPGVYTKHGLALSFLIAPVYFMGGRLAVMFFMNGIAALLTLNIYQLALETTGNRRIAWLCWGLLSFTAPVFSFAYLIFPQLCAALFLGYSYRRIRLYKAGINSNNLQWFLTGLSTALLVWLHYLYVIFSITLALYLVIGRHKSSNQIIINKRVYITFFVPAVVLSLLYFAYNIFLYGVPWPNSRDHFGFAEPWLFPLGFFGLLFDQKYGLLMYSPVYLLAICWLFYQFSRRKEINTASRSEFYWLLGLLLPYYLVVADYNHWWGQWGPPARYMLLLVPLLVVPLAQAIQAISKKNFITRIFLSVTAIWGGLFTAAFILDPRLSFHWEDTSPAKVLVWLENNIGFLKGAALGNFFPGYVNLVEPLTPVFWLSHLFWFMLAVLVGKKLIKNISANKKEARELSPLTPS